MFSRLRNLNLITMRLQHIIEALQVYNNIVLVYYLERDTHSIAEVSALLLGPLGPASSVITITDNADFFLLMLSVRHLYQFGQ